MPKMKIDAKLLEHLKTLTVAELAEDGSELNNPTPDELLVNPSPLTLEQKMKRIIQVEMSKQAEEQGFETFEEADDFDVEDPWEVRQFVNQYDLDDVPDGEIDHPKPPDVVNENTEPAHEARAPTSDTKRADRGVEAGVEDTGSESPPES